MARFGLSNLTGRKIDQWIEQLDPLPFRINMAAQRQQKDNGKELRELYGEFFLTGCKVTQSLLRQLHKHLPEWKRELAKGLLPPSQR